jgi:hypothetical protein
LELTVLFKVALVAVMFVAAPVVAVGCCPGGEDRVNATTMFWGVLVAPAAPTAMVPLYTPAAKPAMFTEAVIVEGAVPDWGETLSQLAPEVTLAVQFNVPLPLLPMFTVWLPGLPAPAVPLKLSDPALSEIVATAGHAEVVKDASEPLLVP